MAKNRVLIEMVATSSDPEATIAYAVSRAADWGHDSDWTPTFDEAVMEIVLGGGSPADGFVEIIDVGHTETDPTDD